MVDEAHARRRAGRARCGNRELLGVEDRVDLRMGTFSKTWPPAAASSPGRADVIEYLRFQSRPFLFTAAAVPAAVGAALAAVRICRSDEGRELFARVLEAAEHLHAGCTSSASTSSSPGPARRRAR